MAVIPNGVYRLPHDCGWKTDYALWDPADPRAKAKLRAAGSVQHHKKLCPLIVPQAWSFQHFLDGTLPKLAQVADYLLADPEVKVILEIKPGIKMVEFLLRKLGFGKDRILKHPTGNTQIAYVAEEMVNSCMTPPVHPLLWRKARSLLIRDDYDGKRGTKVIYTSRRSASHGRRVRNEGAVLALLKKRPVSFIHVHPAI